MAKMLGLDTSVVLRLLIGEPQRQAETALAFLQTSAAKGKQAKVSDLVISEAYFALHHHYEVPKKDALKSLLDLLESDLITPQTGSDISKVLKTTLSSSKKLGFLDRLIHSQYERESCTLLTFEKTASRLPNAILLKA